MQIVANADRPELPELKLEVRRRQAREWGKEFDEAAERVVLGLPAAKDPEYIFANPERRKLTEMEDKRENREMLAAIKAAQEADEKTKLLTEIAELRAQVNELMGDRAKGVKPAPSPLSADEGTTALPEGEVPTAGWQLAQIKEYAAQHGIYLPKGGVGNTKLALVNHIHEELAKKVTVGSGDPEE